MRMKIIIISIIGCVFLVSVNATAIEVAPRITDREIIEALAELKAGQKAIQQQIADLKDSTNKQIADTNRRIDDTNRRIDDLRDEVSDLKTFMLWGFGILFGGMGMLMGFVIWDRRTALATAIQKNKELEERDDKIEKALKEYAFKEPRLAEILRNVGIM